MKINQNKSTKIAQSFDSVVCWRDAVDQPLIARPEFALQMFGYGKILCIVCHRKTVVFDIIPHIHHAITDSTRANNALRASKSAWLSVLTSIRADLRPLMLSVNTASKSANVVGLA